MLAILSKALFWRLAVIVWGVVLYALSAQPGIALPGGFPGIDKVEHATNDRNSLLPRFRNSRARYRRGAR